MLFIRSLRNWNATFNNAMLTIAGVLLTVSMLLIVTNGIIRNFTAPIGAVVEIVSWCASIITVFSLGATQVTKGHVYIDLIFNKLPATLRRIIEILTTIASILFFSIVTYQLFKYGMNFKASGTLSTTLRIEFWPIVLVAAFGFISLITTLIINLLYLLFGKGEDDEWAQEQLL